MSCPIFPIRNIKPDCYKQIEEQWEIVKQILKIYCIDEVFVICRIINVEVRVISRTKGEAINKHTW